MDRQASLGVLDPERTVALDRIVADDAAFRDWYDLTMPRVYRYLYHRCGRRQDLAEELTQQVFVDAVRSSRQFTGGDVVGWLIGIARHRLVDHFRRLERRERGILRIIASRPDPAVTWIGDRSGDDDLAAALAALPAAQRSAMVLKYVDDLPVRDVARLMDRSEGAVESLLSRGRETLRRELGGRER